MKKPNDQRQVMVTVTVFLRRKDGKKKVLAVRKLGPYDLERETNLPGMAMADAVASLLRAAD